MSMTIAEKIVARKGSRDRVRPGDIVTVEVDTTILFDNNFMPSNWREVLKVRDPAWDRRPRLSTSALVHMT